LVPLLSRDSQYAPAAPQVKLRLTSPRFSHFPDEMVKLGHHG
jgi:hypothetical protein